MADDIHDETDSADLVGQPTSAHSLGLCGSGEGKAWKQDTARFPNPDREKNQRLVVPAVEGDKGQEGFYLDYALKPTRTGNMRKVLVGGMPAHKHSLTRHNLAAAYAEFAATCPDPEIARYAKVQAMAKTPQTDGRGNKFAAYRDRPRKEREPQAQRDMQDSPTYVCSETPTECGPECWCFTCLTKR